MLQPAGDRNLLFGILALQMDFIRRKDLIARGRPPAREGMRKGAGGQCR
jgi:hypothetical protein